MLSDRVQAAGGGLDGDGRTGDGIIAAQAIEIDRQHAVSCDRDQLEIFRHRLGTRRARDRRWRRGRVVLVVSVCTGGSNNQQQCRESVDATDDGNAHGNNPSRSEWTPWSCDQSPVARRLARTDYERDFGGLAGASGSMPARVGGAGTMMSSAFERGGQLGSGSANVIGTQHGQPDAQQPPLQAGAALRSSSGAPEVSSAVTRACPVASRAV